MIGFVGSGCVVRERRTRTRTCAVNRDWRTSRRDVTLSLAAVLVGLTLGEGIPGETIPAEEPKRVKKPKKGTKEEKSYQLCLSQCLYNCTQPKATLAKDRGSCRTECKDEW
ncbi:hypothetical protein NDN08_007519 [Rhodosorus marinus]|uniref:Uncharacterized protein n=1 Tax=Rhodosorus marinus TaxID=101924 RepID=A0AAV8V2J2_9RHOD|nr:hypothetical protein NDN08_007519 [Rhodosorus marinus]